MGEVVDLNEQLGFEMPGEEQKETSLEEKQSTLPKIIEFYDERQFIKSNRLIESRYRLSTAQSRLVNLAMVKLKKVILDKNLNLQQVEDALNTARFEKIYVDVVDYEKTYAINSNNLYGELAKVAVGLQTELIFYRDDDMKLNSINWVSQCQYDKNNGRIGILFNPALIKDLMIFKNRYTGVLIDSVKNIKLKYSFRIYELCKQYLKIGRRSFDVEDLRFLLALKDTEYRQYGDFKKSVILKSVKEINKTTDIYIEFREIETDKKTRKVKRIEFIIRKNDSFNSLSLGIDGEGQLTMFEDGSDYELLPEERSMISMLNSILGYNVTAGEADTIINEAMAAIEEHKLVDVGILDYITIQTEYCKQYTKRMSLKGEVVANPVGLLISALRDNYGGRYATGYKEIDYKRYGCSSVEELEDLLLRRNNEQNFKDEVGI